jgi:O-antigen ligase
MTISLKSILNTFVLFLVFLIPLIWSKYLNANYVSAKFFIFYFVSAFSLFLSTQKLIIPKMPKLIGFCLIFIGFLHLSSPLISQKWIDIFYMFKFLGFAFLFYYFYQLKIDLESFFRKYSWVFLLTTALIVVFAFIDFYHLRIEKDDIKSGFLLGSFGNVNMVAEFLIISLPLLHYWLRSKDSIHYSLKYIVLIGWLFFVFYCRSRSAWIGLGLWVAWALFNKNLNKKELLALVISFGLYQTAVLTPTAVSYSSDVKQNSFAERLHLYKATFELIKDNPLGIGVGQFITEIVPYLINSEFRPMEYVYFDQPHSEILKWAAQFGWMGIILTIVLIGYFLANLVIVLIKPNEQKISPALRFFLGGSLLTLLPQIFFQFPFENPATLMYVSFVFAVWVSTFAILREYKLNFKKQIVFFALAFIGVLHSVAYVTSILMETSHNNNLDLIEYSCDIYPINVNACFNKNHFLMATNNYVQARLNFSQDLENFPFHAGLLRLLPIYLKNKSTEQKTCESILMYNYMYVDQKFFAQPIVKSCAVFATPVIKQTPKQFRKDYVTWKRQLF